MAIKKSQLYSSLWASCDELRGGMDASQYKDYVLTMLFMKYVCDKPGLLEIPEGGSFDDIVALEGDKDIGNQINIIITKFAEENDLKGVIDQADFNDEQKLGKGKDMQDRLSKLVAIFNDLDFSGNHAEGDDLLGDAYEYLMRHFAVESGKAKGQFYTPAEVSRILAKVVGIGAETKVNQTVYDPTCGSGSLLLKASVEAPGGMTIYGQEMDPSTWALSKMNMILHGAQKAEIAHDNTLSSPFFKNDEGGLKTFDFAVANPPFSAKSWTIGFSPENDEYDRFAYGIPPAKNGDYAFLLHIVKSLKSKGKGAIILPHGVLFRGNKEADIRRNLINQGLIKGIIGLPANLFYGTGIPACIVILDKEHASSRKGIFMIDASKGFVKDGNKNRLRHQDIHKIVDVFNQQVEIDRFSRMVPFAEIASSENEYNLNIPRYIDSSELEDLHDLDAHLRGGIPSADIDDLSRFWEVLPSLRKDLFDKGDRDGYLNPKVESQEVKPTILGHDEFQSYACNALGIYSDWSSEHSELFNELGADCNPKTIIHTISESMLAKFSDISLLSRYDVYQRLMEYWDDTMQDDLFLISTDGWVDAAKPRPTLKDAKGKKDLETPDLKIGSGRSGSKWQMDLVPPALIVAKYFADEKEPLDELTAKHDEANRELEEFIEECAGEEDLLDEAKSDAGKVTKGAITARTKLIKGDDEFNEEFDALTQVLALMDTESKAKKKASDAQKSLNNTVLAKYNDLTEEEIKAIVIEDKWMHSIRQLVEGEVNRLSNRLSTRVQELRERYESTMSELESAVEQLEQRVDKHLESMGLVLA